MKRFAAFLMTLILVLSAPMAMAAGFEDIEKEFGVSFSAFRVDWYDIYFNNLEYYASIGSKQDHKITVGREESLGDVNLTFHVLLEKPRFDQRSYTVYLLGAEDIRYIGVMIGENRYRLMSSQGGTITVTKDVYAVLKEIAAADGMVITWKGGDAPREAVSLSKEDKARITSFVDSLEKSGLADHLDDGENVVCITKEE